MTWADALDKVFNKNTIKTVDEKGIVESLEGDIHLKSNGRKLGHFRFDLCCSQEDLDEFWTIIKDTLA